MRDFTEDSWRRLKAAQERLGEFFLSYGYRSLETPIVEPTELFLRKSGGELAARMYTFTDPGGNRASLRPEYTASVLRHYIEEEADERLPVRLQYAGPVFRHEPDSTAYRQFTQVGVELLGSFDPGADAEILSLSWMGLSTLGLTGHRLELGDLGVLYQLLESLELSERATAFVLGNMAQLRAGPEGLVAVLDRAKQLHVVPSESRPNPSEGGAHLGAAIGEMADGAARELLHGLLEWEEVGPLGQRQPSDVVERLLRKFRGTDDPNRLERGLQVASGLAEVKGDAEESLRKAKQLIESWGLDPSALDRLKEVISLLDFDQPDGPAVVLDFGLTRGLAYYTGMVFEIRHPDLEASLGGGGRYDGLARALGSPSNIPALGFAYTLEYLLDSLQWHGEPWLGGGGPDRILVLAQGDAYRQALQRARELRGQGKVAEMEMSGMSVEESLSYARAKGFGEVITVDLNGKTTSHRVKGMP